MIVSRIHAADELHRQKPVAFVEDQLLQVHEVRMPNFLKGTKFLLEKGDRLCAALGQHLQGNGRAALAIQRLVNDATRTAPEQRTQLEARGTAKLDGCRCTHVPRGPAATA
jgi:hypothetical protein